jgi:hypothetical protein
MDPDPVIFVIDLQQVANKKLFFFFLLDPDPNPDPLGRGMDPRIRIQIRTKISWFIRGKPSSD